MKDRESIVFAPMKAKAVFFVEEGTTRFYLILHFYLFLTEGINRMLLHFYGIQRRMFIVAAITEIEIIASSTKRFLSIPRHSTPTFFSRLFQSESFILVFHKIYSISLYNVKKLRTAIRNAVSFCVNRSRFALSRLRLTSDNNLFKASFNFA